MYYTHPLKDDALQPEIESFFDPKLPVSTDDLIDEQLYCNVARSPTDDAEK